MLVAFILPTGLLTFGIGRLWNRLANWPWRPAVQRGIGSVAVGLVLAGGIVLARGALSGPFYIVLAVLVFLLLIRTKINPAIPIVLSGAIGLGVYFFG